MRPLSEAGEVPEGCQRYYFISTLSTGGRVKIQGDTHFADIRLPVPAEKADPLVTKSDSSPEWTPQAGDVVRLKSGGPLMTVDFIEFDSENNETLVNCLWIKPNGDPSGLKIPTHMLQSATK